MAALVPTLGGLTDSCYLQMVTWGGFGAAASLGVLRLVAPRAVRALAAKWNVEAVKIFVALLIESASVTSWAPFEYLDTMRVTPPDCVIG